MKNYTKYELVDLNMIPEIHRGKYDDIQEHIKNAKKGLVVAAENYAYIKSAIDKGAKIKSAEFKRENDVIEVLYFTDKSGKSLFPIEPFVCIDGEEPAMLPVNELKQYIDAGYLEFSDGTKKLINKLSLGEEKQIVAKTGEVLGVTRDISNAAWLARYDKHVVDVTKEYSKQLSQNVLNPLAAIVATYPDRRDFFKTLEQAVDESSAVLPALDAAANEAFGVKNNNFYALAEKALDAKVHELRVERKEEAKVALKEKYNIPIAQKIAYATSAALSTLMVGSAFAGGVLAADTNADNSQGPYTNHAFVGPVKLNGTQSRTSNLTDSDWIGGDFDKIILENPQKITNNTKTDCWDLNALELYDNQLIWRNQNYGLMYKNLTTDEENKIKGDSDNFNIDFDGKRAIIADGTSTYIYDAQQSKLTKISGGNLNSPRIWNNYIAYKSGNKVMLYNEKTNSTTEFESKNPTVYTDWIGNGLDLNEGKLAFFSENNVTVNDLATNTSKILPFSDFTISGSYDHINNLKVSKNWVGFSVWRLDDASVNAINHTSDSLIRQKLDYASDDWDLSGDFAAWEWVSSIYLYDLKNIHEYELPYGSLSSSEFKGPVSLDKGKIAWGYYNPGNVYLTNFSKNSKPLIKKIPADTILFNATGEQKVEYSDQESDVLSMSVSGAFEKIDNNTFRLKEVYRKQPGLHEGSVIITDEHGASTLLPFNLTVLSEEWIGGEAVELIEPSTLGFSSIGTNKISGNNFAAIYISTTPYLYVYDITKRKSKIVDDNISQFTKFDFDDNLVVYPKMNDTSLKDDIMIYNLGNGSKKIINTNLSTISVSTQKGKIAYKGYKEYGAGGLEYILMDKDGKEIIHKSYPGSFNAVDDNLVSTDGTYLVYIHNGWFKVARTNGELSTEITNVGPNFGNLIAKNGKAVFYASNGGWKPYMFKYSGNSMDTTNIPITSETSQDDSDLALSEKSIMWSSVNGPITSVWVKNLTTNQIIKLYEKQTTNNNEIKSLATDENQFTFSDNQTAMLYYNRLKHNPFVRTFLPATVGFDEKWNKTIEFFDKDGDSVGIENIDSPFWGPYSNIIKLRDEYQRTPGIYDGKIKVAKGYGLKKLTTEFPFNLTVLPDNPFTLDQNLTGVTGKDHKWSKIFNVSDIDHDEIGDIYVADNSFILEKITNKTYRVKLNETFAIPAIDFDKTFTSQLNIRDQHFMLSPFPINITLPKNHRPSIDKNLTGITGHGKGWSMIFNVSDPDDDTIVDIIDFDKNFDILKLANNQYKISLKTDLINNTGWVNGSLGISDEHLGPSTYFSNPYNVSLLIKPKENVPVDDDVTPTDDDVTPVDDDVTPTDDDVTPTDDDVTPPTNGTGNSDEGIGLVGSLAIGGVATAAAVVPAVVGAVRGSKKKDDD